MAGSRNALRLLVLTANITCFSEARYLSWGQMLKRFMTCNISSSLLWYHNKVGARTWQWNWVYRFRVFIGVNCLSKWIKMKTTYRYISNHDSFQWNWNYGKFQLRPAVLRILINWLNVVLWVEKCNLSLLVLDF